MINLLFVLVSLVAVGLLAYQLHETQKERDILKMHLEQPRETHKISAAEHKPLYFGCDGQQVEHDAKHTDKSEQRIIAERLSHEVFDYFLDMLEERPDIVEESTNPNGVKQYWLTLYVKKVV